MEPHKEAGASREQPLPSAASIRPLLMKASALLANVGLHLLHMSCWCHLLLAQSGRSRLHLCSVCVTGSCLLKVLARRFRLHNFCMSAMVSCLLAIPGCISSTHMTVPCLAAHLASMLGNVCRNMTVFIAASMPWLPMLCSAGQAAGVVTAPHSLSL